MDGEKGPDERGLKPSLTTTHAKASRRVIETLWAGKTMGWTGSIQARTVPTCID
ncbi:MAG TPA: hypothetical protein VIM51_00845 [Desulfosporosinus sp.]